MAAVSAAGAHHFEAWALDDIVYRNRIRPAASDWRSDVLVPGRNCWRVETAPRAAVLVDACEFFRRVDQAFRAARHSILLIGWDFDGRIRLCPDTDDCPSLGQLLRSLVEERPDLHVNILIWSVATIHAPSGLKQLLVGEPWQDHPRIAVRLDSEHPFYASHHQKIIVVDDSVAFCGGIDLTVDRWDTCEHAETNELRVLPDGKPYYPVHDVQMVVNGDAAHALGELARERWRRGTGERLPEPHELDPDVWPFDLKPEFERVPVAISRTEPGWRDHAAVEEISALTIDLLKAARHTIYIEAQYFTARNIRSLLEQSLLAKDGPEIIVMVTRATHSLMERVFLGENRDRLVRRLRRADRHNRLRIYYPLVPGKGGPCNVLIHAKVMLIDDQFARVGSANLNNRSMGLDTECDLVIEANGGNACRAIAALRARLLGEHLGIAPEQVQAGVAQHKSLIHAIDALNRGERGLRPYPELKLDGPVGSRVGTMLADPTRPPAPLWWRRRKRFRQATRSTPPRRRRTS
jgi:phosphatidylserine/phosphatidylglycerophosphate/cardiolipin synthase-like enzyme